MCIIVVFAILLQGDTILLVKNRDDKEIERWTLPGGKVEEGETLFDALHREVFEETAIQVTQPKVAYVHEAFFSNVKAHVRATIFQAQIKEGHSLELPIQDPAKRIIVKQWVPTADLSKYIKNKGILSPLHDWLQHFQTSNYLVSKNLKW